MDDDAQEIAALVRSGAYFEQARDWYQAVYIGPISERTFFLLVAVFSLIIALAGFSAVLSLQPLTERPALLIKSYGRIDAVIPRLDHLKEPEQTLTDSLMRFFIIRYVTAHEGYTAATYESSARFVRAQSNDDTYNAFSAGYTADNPQSPAALLGTVGEREITVQSISLDKQKDWMTAKVVFTAENLGTPDDTKTRWTARLQYTYTDLISEVVRNSETGAKELNIQDPQFQVVSYALTQNK